MGSENISWLTTVPASDMNFKNRLKEASDEEIKKAVSEMRIRFSKGDETRIFACKRELRRREKNAAKEKR